MRITYKNNPALKFLDGGYKKGVFIDEQDLEYGEAIRNIIKNIFPSLVKYFRSNICIVRETFFQHIRDTGKSLNELLKQEIMDGIFYHGTILCKDFTAMYFMRTFADVEEYESAIFLFDLKGTIRGIKVRDMHSGNKHTLLFLSNNNEETVIKDIDSKDQFMNTALSTCCAVEVFKKYAPVETKNCPSKKTTKFDTFAYKNDTNFDITYLDCKWFTNLIQSNEFKVRGHFRLQPYGTKRTERKLIWIADFKKHGYTSRAKKENFE